MKPISILHLQFFLRLSALTCTMLLVSICAFSQTVYVTKTGSKYHKSGCQYLSKSKIAIQVDTAITRSYMACSVCKPSVSSSSAQGIAQFESINKNPTSSSQCTALTKAGNRCSRMTKEGNGKCWQHQ
jgi:hypothetical protein